MYYFRVMSNLFGKMIQSIQERQKESTRRGKSLLNDQGSLTRGHGGHQVWNSNIECLLGPGSVLVLHHIYDFPNVYPYDVGTSITNLN